MSAKLHFVPVPTSEQTIPVIDAVTLAKLHYETRASATTALSVRDHQSSSPDRHTILTEVCSIVAKVSKNQSIFFLGFHRYEMFLTVNQHCWQRGGGRGEDLIPCNPVVLWDGKNWISKPPSHIHQFQVSLASEFLMYAQWNLILYGMGKEKLGSLPNWFSPTGYCKMLWSECTFY